jgi:hypothetical protein
MVHYKNPEEKTSLKMAGLVFVTVGILCPCAIPILFLSDNNHWSIVFFKYFIPTFLAGFLFFGLLDEIKLKLGLYDA